MFGEYERSWYGLRRGGLLPVDDKKYVLKKTVFYTGSIFEEYPDGKKNC